MAQGIETKTVASASTAATAISANASTELIMATSLSAQSGTIATQKWLYTDKVLYSKYLFENLKGQSYPLYSATTDFIYVDSKNTNIYWYLPEFILEENSLNFQSEFDMSEGAPKTNINGEPLYKAKVSFAVQKRMPPVASTKFQEIKKLKTAAITKEIPAIGGVVNVKLKCTIFNDNAQPINQEFNPVLKSISGNRYEFEFDLPFEGLKILYVSLNGPDLRNTLTISGNYMMVERTGTDIKYISSSLQAKLGTKVTEPVFKKTIFVPAKKTATPAKVTETVKVKNMSQRVMGFTFPCAQNPTSYKVKNTQTQAFTPVGCTKPWSNSLEKFSDIQPDAVLGALLNGLGIKEVYASVLEYKQYLIVPKEYQPAWVFSGNSIEETRATAGAFINTTTDPVTNNSFLQMDFIVAPAISNAQMDQIRQKIYQYCVNTKKLQIKSADEIVIRFPDIIDENESYTFIPAGIPGVTTVTSSGNYLFGPGECFKVSLLFQDLLLTLLLSSSIKNPALGISSSVPFKLNDYFKTSSVFNIKMNRLTGDPFSYTPENPVNEITVENKTGLNLLMEGLQLSKSATEYKEIPLKQALAIDQKIKIDIAAAMVQPVKWNIQATLSDNIDAIISEQSTNIIQDAEQQVSFVIIDAEWFNTHKISQVEIVYELAQAGTGNKTVILTPAVLQQAVQITLPLIKYLFNRTLTVVVKCSFTDGKPIKTMNAVVFDLQESGIIRIDSKLAI